LVCGGLRTIIVELSPPRVYSWLKIASLEEFFVDWGVITWLFLVLKLILKGTDDPITT